MKLHPRHELVVKAGISVKKAVVEAVKQYDLTYAELIGILSGEIQSWTKFQLRDERAEDGIK